MQPTLTLPLELVERIVDFAGQESTKNCMLVSRQFHAGALRKTYRYQSLDLKARDDVLSKKYHRLFGDQDQFLLRGSRGRYVRELSIKFGDWPRFWDKKEPEYEEDSLLQLLEAFSKKTGLQELHVLGGGFEYKWDSLPLKVREGLRTLMTSPSLSRLSLQEVHGLPADILHGNKTLRRVDLAQCQNVTNATDHAVMLPEATRLWSHYLEPVRNGFLLPRLQILTAHHSTVEQQQETWVRIGRAREALRCINIFDNENAKRGNVMPPALPASLKLSDLPELWYLGYTYEGGSCIRAGDLPLLYNVIPFFETTLPVLNFSTLKLQLSLDQRDGNVGEEYWMERKDLIATDPSWATLDTVLASDHYPKLEDLWIDLKIFNAILEEVDYEIMQDAYPHYTGEKKAFAADIKDMILGQFIKSKARGIDVLVEVHADF